MPASLMRICVVLAVTVCALDTTAAAFLKRSGTEQASLLPTDAQNKVTLAVQMKKLKEESAEDFKKCIGNVDEAQALSSTMNKKNFDTILAQAKKYFKLSCSGDSSCLNQLTTKVTGFTVARLDREAAADPASQGRGLDGEYVSLKNVIEIEAAIDALYSKSKEKLTLLSQFENDAATAKDYKGAAAMKKSFNDLNAIVESKFKSRTKCNATSTEPECSVTELQRTYNDILGTLTDMKTSGALSPVSTSPSTDPLLALLKIYEGKWHDPRTTEQQKTVLVFIMEQIRKAMELQTSLAEAVRAKEWERAHVLQQYSANAQQALMAKLKAYYEQHGEVPVNSTNVATQAAEAAVAAILQAETTAKQDRDEITTKCALMKMVVAGSPPQSDCNEMDTDYGCTYDVKGEQSMWVKGGANGCSGSFSCYGQVVSCKAAARSTQTCSCDPPKTAKKI